MVWSSNLEEARRFPVLVFHCLACCLVRRDSLGFISRLTARHFQTLERLQFSATLFEDRPAHFL
jgi:hypothetical protein